MDDGVQVFENTVNNLEKYDPSKIVERNQRIIKKYQYLRQQSLKRSLNLQNQPNLQKHQNHLSLQNLQKVKNKK